MAPHVRLQAARKEAALALMRDSAARAEATGASNAAALAALSDQMTELRAAQLDWQQNVLSGRLAALREDSQRIAANDRLKVCGSSGHGVAPDQCKAELVNLGQF